MKELSMLFSNTQNEFIVGGSTRALNPDPRDPDPDPYGHAAQHAAQI